MGLFDLDISDLMLTHERVKHNSWWRMKVAQSITQLQTQISRWKEAVCFKCFSAGCTVPPPSEGSLCLKREHPLIENLSKRTTVPGQEAHEWLCNKDKGHLNQSQEVTFAWMWQDSQSHIHIKIHACFLAHTLCWN